MKTTVFLAIATLVPGIFLMQANGGASVAVIDFERAVSEAPGGKDSMTTLTTFRKEQERAIQEKQQEEHTQEKRHRKHHHSSPQPFLKNQNLNRV
jgi:Skp family chaperone for outer membrane proteins